MTTAAANPYAFLNGNAGVVANSTTGNTSNADASRAQLAGNFNTFLTLLTSQLQNQDPLSPMDSTQFTQQLVQFSQVEQQIQTNSQLSDLVAQYRASSAGTALSYIGRDAIIDSNATVLANGQANWAYTLPSSADNVTLTVRDSANHDVFTTTGDRTAGSHRFTWNGQTSAGGTAAPGVYQLVISARNNNGDTVTPSTSVRENISGVDFSSATPTIITASGSHSVDSIRAILDGG